MFAALRRTQIDLGDKESVGLGLHMAARVTYYAPVISSAHKPILVRMLLHIALDGRLRLKLLHHICRLIGTDQRGPVLKPNLVR